MKDYQFLQQVNLQGYTVGLGQQIKINHTFNKFDVINTQLLKEPNNKIGFQYNLNGKLVEFIFPNNSKFLVEYNHPYQTDFINRIKTL